MIHLIRLAFGAVLSRRWALDGLDRKTVEFDHLRGLFEALDHDLGQLALKFGLVCVSWQVSDFKLVGASNCHVNIDESQNAAWLALILARFVLSVLLNPAEFLLTPDNLAAVDPSHTIESFLELINTTFGGE